MVTTTLLLTLRHNIKVKGDVALARDEVASLCGSSNISEIHASEFRGWLSSVEHLLSGQELRFINRGLKESGVVALSVNQATTCAFQRIIDQASFIQEAILINSSASHCDSPLSRKLTRSREIGNERYVLRGLPIAAILEYSAPLVFKRNRTSNLMLALDDLVELLLDESPVGNGLASHINTALEAKKTTLYLSHELHLYKGKFFPRLVHSLLNRYASKGSIIADPFAGSGTALLEASLLGYDSIGIDVDPTSVLISQHKTALAFVDPSELLEVCMAMETAVENQPSRLFFEKRAYDISTWHLNLIRVPDPMRQRLAKRGSEEGYDLLGEIERDSAIALALISHVPSHLQSIFLVCLSHALTKKIRLRFVGIGNGRFTFDVAKVRVLELFLKKSYHMLAIAEVFSWLRQSGLRLGNVQVHRESALRLDNVIARDSIDVVLTSPPYIPASSGREHYARARAIPLVLTGAAKTEELEILDRDFIGEMSGQGNDNEDHEPMPPKVERTLSFLNSDDQRRPKHLPTVQYYRDIRHVLKNIKQVLKETGKALFVVADAHTFYIHKTKEILHTVDATGAICEIGEQAGLCVEDVIEVPLMKSGGLNARPRSTDQYSEAVVVFRRNG